MVIALLFGGLTLGACLLFYAAGFFSIPKVHRKRLASALPWVALLAIPALLYAGTAAWLAYAGNKGGGGVVLGIAGVVSATVGQRAVRKRFQEDWGGESAG